MRDKAFDSGSRDSEYEPGSPFELLFEESDQLLERPFGQLVHRESGSDTSRRTKGLCGMAQPRVDRLRFDRDSWTRQYLQPRNG